MGIQAWEVDATLFLVMHETFSPGPEKYVQIPFKARPK